MGIDLLKAKTFPSYTLACTICGYIIGIITIPRFISQVNALRFCTVLGTVFTLLIIFAKGTVQFLGHTADLSIWFVVLLGLANSLVSVSYTHLDVYKRQIGDSFSPSATMVAAQCPAAFARKEGQIGASRRD